ncbi:glycoside hydrolase domain-containing protein [Clostridium algidicarnis]|uniref:Peptidoglycan hydrolase-like protein with peptidoglycan-binding domain n=1 Tax=Clostridium algidicarnis DSM 15099 TaxID=1121295 RepID=A0A2S6FYU7_9CLOT|nr:glycoside hydrolase domain-containing protein [Clostridium algidicarnis]PPK48795.1 peptidoglycan hydrolase-like protein with peptidoglycan-binding domain [Clostridium algidicarnis DSM 15099]
MADKMVKLGQEWLNTTYGNDSRYNVIPKEKIGYTNWPTIYALTRALQIELGITSTSNNFGNGTLNEVNKISPINQNSNTKSNIVKIIQVGLYCKGYGPGGVTGTYGLGTTSEVNRLKINMGVNDGVDGITGKVFKALLNMDYYEAFYDGSSEKVSSIQRWFNSKYGNRRDYFYMPCDGYYSRDTQKALIFALQYEGGMADGVANGNFGPGTQNIVKNHSISVGNTGVFVYLLKAALIFNGYDCTLSEKFSTDDEFILQKFQNFSLLSPTGIANFQTWSSLLVSTGDPNRRGKACDCVTEITQARAQTLKSQRYEIVGRYLTNVEGTSLNKKIQSGELDVIFSNGLTVFPIYQTYGGEAIYFNKDQGKKDASAAFTAAKSYGFNIGTIIYFAVDYDALGEEITSNIIPYFKGIKEKMGELGGIYQLGIYGPRNVCIKVTDEVGVKTSFVSGMSTGFSGNLGFPLPVNWAFDQISTISVGSGDGFIEIDNNIKSGRDLGQKTVNASVDNTTPDVVTKIQYIYELKQEVATLVDSKMTAIQKMKALRSRDAAANIVLSQDINLTQISQRFNIRKALIQTVFMWECCLEGIDDIASDTLVLATYNYYKALEEWENLSVIEKAIVPAPKPPIPIKDDSSTGMCQIFARTAIKAINFSIDRGLISGMKYDTNDWHNVAEVWHKLHNDLDYCVYICALVLMWGANDINIGDNYYDYSPEEIKKVIARYNGTGSDASEYGIRNYELYNIFEHYNKLSRS